MDTNVLSELSLQMLKADSKDPIRREVLNVVKLGMDLQVLQKIVNNGKAQGVWLKYIEDNFGKSNQSLCARALGLYRHRIPMPALIAATSASDLYQECTMGYFKKYKHDPRNYWMKILRMQNETPTLPEAKPKTSHSQKQKLTRQKSNDPNYYERPNKDIVENFVINMGRQYFQDNKVNALTIVGKRYQKHVNRLFNAFAQHVYIFEHAPAILKDIKQKSAHCPYSSEGYVTIIPMNADEITILDCPFIDLDIEGTFPNVTDTIRKHA